MSINQANYFTLNAQNGGLTIDLSGNWVVTVLDDLQLALKAIAAGIVISELPLMRQI